MTKAASVLLIALVAMISIAPMVRSAPEKLTKEEVVDAVVPCVCATTDDLRPVCGTNGETYVNISDLECAVKCKKADVQLLKDGPCNPQQQS